MKRERVAWPRHLDAAVATRTGQQLDWWLEGYRYPSQLGFQPRRGLQ